jgi:hypothetical protein
VTLRERLADWISGGKYSANAIQAIRIHDFAARAWKAEDALDAIAAMETPKANATVRRMAKIAREALE